MPIATRPARAFATACLAVATLLTALPAPAAALEPPRPLPGYRANFVTQTDQRPSTDCLWASGAMLLDKWTNGDLTVSHQALRAKSGDRVGGSTFDELKTAYAKYGFQLKFSPDGGDPMTWGQLLTRLRKGAGAVLLGDYGDLPRYYGRWDYKFWKKNKEKDNHAVYIERYSRGRVWLMDPLGRGDWKGEWISVWDLRKFAWSAGGYVYAATTPTAKAAPFSGVKASKPKILLTPTAVDATWTLKAPKRWKLPRAEANVVFAPAGDPLLAAAHSPTLPTRATDADAPQPVAVSLTRKSLRLTAPLPEEPGAYVATLAVTDRRFGRSFVTAEGLAVFVPGDRRASLRVNVQRAGVEAGSALKVSVNVANTGTETWMDTRTAGTAVGAVTRTTRVEARWISLDVPAPDVTAPEVDTQALATATQTLGLVPLAAGEATMVRASILAPLQTGRWVLVVDVADEDVGSYAALGSAPAMTTIKVVEPRGFEPIE